MNIAALIQSRVVEYGQLPRILRGLMTIFITLLMVACFFLFMRSSISGRAGEFMDPYSQSNRYISAYIDSAQFPKLILPEYRKIFLLQNNIIVNRREHHFRMALTFFKNYYAVLFTLITVSCLGGLILFILVSKGWDASPFSLKMLFIALAASTVFFSVFSAVFSQQQNFQENMVRYMSYTKAELNLAQDIQQLAKEEFPIKKIKLAKSADSLIVVDTMRYYRQLDTLIVKNNATLNNLTNYVFSIDGNQVRNISDIYKALAGFRNGADADTLQHR